ncbi:MAG: hypothetical protein R3324_04230, partial [Halobacteriales archaeon]|nr:hypothetical protein [Halobacteriales archaeon]
MTVFNVQDYGADPTTSSNDADDIQAALNAAANAGGYGHEVYIPAVPNYPSDYYVLNPGGENAITLTDRHNGVTLRGDGPESYLRMAGGRTSNHRGIVYAPAYADRGTKNLQDITFETFQLDGNYQNNQSAPNGWGITTFENRSSTPSDDNIVMQGLKVTGWRTTGITVGRTALAQFCTSHDNEKHGFATIYGRRHTHGKVNRIHYCHTYGNGYYGVDYHGKGEVRWHVSDGDGYGYKSANDWDTTNIGAGHVHELYNSVARNFRVYGYTITNPIEELYIGECLFEDGGGWGCRFTKGMDTYIRGPIKCRNVGQTRVDEGGFRIYGSEGTSRVVDESGVTSRLWASRCGPSNDRQPALRIGGGTDPTAGKIDEVYYDSSTVATSAIVGETNSTVDVGQRLTASESTQPTIDVPSDSEVGYEAFGGGGGGGSGPTNFTPATDVLTATVPSPSFSLAGEWYDQSWTRRMKLTVNSGYVSAGPHTDFPLLVN